MDQSKFIGNQDIFEGRIEERKDIQINPLMKSTSNIGENVNTRRTEMNTNPNIPTEVLQEFNGTSRQQQVSQHLPKGKIDAAAM